MNREELLEKYGKGRKVLDHGCVRLVDVMGDDARIEEVARLSYSRPGEDGISPEVALKKRRDLLRYLMRHRHTSPFEQATITLDIKLPIFVARQLVRHRTQSLNEVSGRYSVLPEEFYVPDPAQVCKQSPTNKQGRAEPLEERFSTSSIEAMQKHGSASFDLYNRFMDLADMSRETARMHLPLSTYTHWYTTWDAHNLLHMLGLRLDSHAQWEIRQFGEAIAEIVRDWLPITWEAFEDYRMEAATFSKHELVALRKMLGLFAPDAIRTMVKENPNLSERERADFLRTLTGGET